MSELSSDKPYFPEIQELETALAKLFEAKPCPENNLRILGREENPYPRSHSSEIVICRTDTSGEQRLFCKYMTVLEEGHRDHGMRGGIGYEGLIYQQYLDRRIRPAFHGLHHGSQASVWLILECLDDTCPLDLADDETMIYDAASWLGTFQFHQQQNLGQNSPSEIKIYNADFYRDWSQRAHEYAGVWHHRRPWLGKVCEAVEKVIDVLTSRPPTLVHGEFYPHNILVRHREVFIVDWESAAIGPGEIDLAALTEGWPEEDVLQCVLRYQKARWPEGFNEGFEERLIASRVFTHLRWIGEHADWAKQDDAEWRLAELEIWASRFGLFDSK